MLRANINMETVTKECCLKIIAKLFDYAYLKRCRTWLLVSEGLYMSEFNPIWRKFGHPIWTLHSYLKEIWKEICQSIFQPCTSFFLFASSNMFILTPPINANLTHSQLSPSSGTFLDLLCPMCLTWSDDLQSLWNTQCTRVMSRSDAWFSVSLNCWVIVDLEYWVSVRTLVEVKGVEQHCFNEVLHLLTEDCK